MNPRALCLLTSVLIFSGCTAHRQAVPNNTVSIPLSVAIPQAMLNTADPSMRDLPASSWTVQIAALKSLDEIEQVEKENDLTGLLRVPTYDAELGNLHAVLFGVYPTQEAAEHTAAALPYQLAGDDPWVRSIASVQAVMR